MAIPPNVPLLRRRSETSSKRRPLARLRELASAAPFRYRPPSPAHGHPWRRERGHSSNHHVFGDMNMSDQLTLSAETRERAGKGASRAMRSDGAVPAGVDGIGNEPTQ